PIGNPLGGHGAQKIALQRPDLCRGLVLAGSSGLFERTLEKGVEHRPSRDWIERKIRDLFYDEANIPDGCVDRAYAELSDRRAARAIVKLGRSAKSDHLGSKLHGVRQPTLLLWGRQDNVTPPSVADEFHELLPDSRLVWLDNCGHTPMLERPEPFARSVREFTEELALRYPVPRIADDVEAAEEA
ncbi:MAG: alpha/beta hydrolase, partial [Phycisphaerales bacterium]|nr:alpha/beta hydrolase [Phycisphaerales bacterium]